ncbi:hypothetical protein KC622_01390 [Candidatus Dojkabacteria bacterium]|uniref:Uncharacterized protein n=1 Tax=Candidatus Dojkabacteria bacterium TaxID=2099670 RepID=A0A955HYK7_9BACT|nr:hypothetical protein [Candidatus Dojkabacteria bacterium]MCB9790562.1 hypothetical protein [Candidatus Nomurabacteria bacterium]
MPPIIFVFESFRPKEELLESFDDVFVLNTINKDLKQVLDLAEKYPTRWIIGIAKSRRSRFESQAVNKLGKSKKVNRSNNKFSYKLHVPQSAPFGVNSHYTYTFCNMAAYKLAERLSNPISFCHLYPKDVDILVEYMNSLSPEDLS